MTVRCIVVVLRHLLLCCLSVVGLAAQEGWKLVESGHPRARIHAVGTVSGASWIAASGIGMFKTEDDGRTWTRTADTTLGAMYDVSFADAQLGIAIGTEIYRSTNGGWAWTKIVKPEEPGSLLPALRKIVWFNTLEGLITTDYPTYLRTSDGGLTWGRFRLEGVLSQESVQSVGIHSENRAVIHTNWGLHVSDDRGLTWTFSQDTASMRGPIRYSGMGQGIAFPARGSSTEFSTYTTDGGQSWQGSTTSDTTSEPIVAAAISGPRFAVAVSQFGKVYVSRNGGADWALVNVVTDGRQPNFITAACREDGTGFIAAWGTLLYRIDNFGAAIVPVGRPGRIESSGLVMTSKSRIMISGGRAMVRSTNAGNTWSIMTPTYPFGSSRITAANSELMLVQVPSKKISRSTNGGVTWNVVSYPSNSTIRAMCFVDQQTAVMTTQSGECLRSTDGGTTWSNIGSIPKNNVGDMVVDPTGTIVAIGVNGWICRSRDRGESWDVNQVDSTDRLVSIAFDSIGNAVMISSSGSVYRSEDRGLTWERVIQDSMLNLRRVVCRKGSTFLAIGDNWGSVGVMLSTTDAGRTWKREDVPDLRFRDVTFLNENTGACVTENDELFFWEGDSTTVSVAQGHTETNQPIHVQLRLTHHASESTLVVDINDPRSNIHTVSLWNTQGQQLRSIACGSSTTFDTGHLAPGLYAVSVRSNESTSWQHIVLLQ